MVFKLKKLFFFVFFGFIVFMLSSFFRFSYRKLKIACKHDYTKCIV